MRPPKKQGTNVSVPEWLRKNSELVKQANGLYDAINLNWLRIEEAIIASGVLKPVHLHVMTDPNDGLHYLGIDKMQGKWRIAYDFSSDPFEAEEVEFNWKPIVDCPLWIRQNFLKYAPDLVKAVYESNAEAVSDLAKAVHASEEFLRSMGLIVDLEDL